MLEIVDTKKKLSREKYREIFPALQERLRILQYAARDAQVATIIALEGWDACGRGNIIKHLVQRLDPRLFRVYPGTPPSTVEQGFHFLGRYQVKLPNRGEIALFDHSWYGRVLVERVDRLVPARRWEEAYEQINEFERWLADDGQVLVKLWLHLTRKQQKKRFQEYLDDPKMAYKITDEYRRHHRQYDKWAIAVEEMLAKTDTPHAPWTIVEAGSLRWARVRVFETLIRGIEEALRQRNALPSAEMMRAVMKTAPAAAQAAAKAAEKVAEKIAAKAAEKVAEKIAAKAAKKVAEKIAAKAAEKVAEKIAAKAAASGGKKRAARQKAARQKKARLRLIEGKNAAGVEAAATA